MLETLFWFALGAFVGWNFPQPEFAKTIKGTDTEKIEIIKKYFSYKHASN